MQIEFEHPVEQYESFQNGARELNSQMPHGCKAKLESALFIRVYLCKKTVCTVIVWPLKKRQSNCKTLMHFCNYLV